MTDSAPTGLREQRRQHTATQLTRVSRRLTAERGLAGFTIDELCDEVGISRRTFFNYFAAKEDAILGIDPAEELERFEVEFLEKRSRGWDAVIDDLVELVVAHFATTGIDIATHAELSAAIEREPRLLQKFIGAGRERERDAMRIVAEREGVALDDPRVEASVQILSAVLRTTGERFLDPANTRVFGEVIAEQLAAMRTVLSPRKAQS